MKTLVHPVVMIVGILVLVYFHASAQKPIKPDEKTPFGASLPKKENIKSTLFSWCGPEYEAKGMTHGMCERISEELTKQGLPLDLTTYEWIIIKRYYNCWSNTGYTFELWIKSSIYRIAFTKLELDFAQDGTLLEVEKTFPISMIPPKVLLAFKKDFPEFNPTEFEIDYHSDGSQTYEIKYDKARDLDATYDIAGNRVKNDCED